MAKTRTIQELLPRAVQTLEHPTQPSPADIKKAERWFREGRDPWHLLGNESKEEVKALKLAFETSVKWFASWMSGLEPHWLVLCGPSGTGKTLLARKIERYVTNWGDLVYRRTVAEKLDSDNPRRIYGYVQERAPFASWRDLVPHGQENQERIAKAGTDWIKIIDDLKPQTGTEVTIDGETGIQPKRFEANAAGDLLDQRLRKWTVITSNLTRRQLAVFWDARIASRLLRGGTVVADFSNVSDYGLRMEALAETED